MSKDQNEKACQHPEIGGEPGKCSPEQVKKCHGKDKKHPSNKGN